MNTTKLKGLTGCCDGATGPRHWESGRSFKSRLFDWLAKHFWSGIPEAFEDEFGFHYGALPIGRVPSDTQWDMTNLGASGQK